jgi:AraC family transcriptional regulator
MPSARDIKRRRAGCRKVGSMKPPARAATRSFYEQAVQRAIEHIAAHLDGALDLQTLASGANLSPFHFHRVFRGMVGEAPIELIRRLRLERAAWRLATTDQPVIEAAFDAGYETHEAFTRAFRAAYSTPPTGFRRRAHPRIELAASCGVHYEDTNWTPVFIPRDSGGQQMQVEIREMPAMRVGTVRHVGPYNQIVEAFERMHVLAARAGLHHQAPRPVMLAIYHDAPDTTPQDELRSDAALVFAPAARMPEGFVDQPIAGGRYAMTRHIGPYEQLGDAWARFMGEWLPASGHRVRDGASYEIYRNTPETAPKDRLETELYIPLL